MGLFDIFKKKSNTPASPNVSLEQLLVKAVTEPAYRSEFYKRLLTEELVVITNASELPVGTQVLEKDTKVSILSYPDGKIPVFTSTDRIFDKGVVTEQVNYIQMKGKNLFELAKDTTFLINPYSDYGKELLPEEIQRILSGGTLIENYQRMRIEKDAPVEIGQPTKYPIDIVNSLRILFARSPIVKAAYLGWIHKPVTNEPPHYIFGIDGDGDLQNVINEAGFIAQDFLEKGEFIDFIKVDRRDGVSDYFLKHTDPFYRKTT